jgi:hypothetical protein
MATTKTRPAHFEIWSTTPAGNRGRDYCHAKYEIRESVAFQMGAGHTDITVIAVYKTGEKVLVSGRPSSVVTVADGAAPWA